MSRVQLIGTRTRLTAWGLSLRAGLVLAAFALMSQETLQAEGEKMFNSPTEAVDALKSAVKARDTNALRSIFGPTGHQLVSPDEVEATNDFEMFVKRLNDKVEVVSQSDSREELQIGTDAWPFAIPLVKRDDKWFFDTAAGKEEILNRRIGANELQTIRVCEAYVEAQREYAGELRNGSDVLEYAQKMRSTPGKRDGLYWKVEPGGELSPLGPLIAAAHVEGYRRATKIMTDEQSPYHGYYFKILTRQGRHAPGGKYSYVINGHMIAGFALVAWPEQWDDTGVMTFIVNQQGRVYQKNLGPKTDAIASRLSAYDPDESWQLAGK